MEEATRKQRVEKDSKGRTETQGPRKRRKLRESKTKLRFPGPLLGHSLLNSFENLLMFIVFVSFFLLLFDR